MFPLTQKRENKYINETYKLSMKESCPPQSHEEPALYGASSPTQPAKPAGANHKPTIYDSALFRAKQ